MTDDILMDRIYHFFNKSGGEEVDEEEWILGFNIFLKGKNNVKKGYILGTIY